MKRYEVSPTGGQGRQRGVVNLANVRGASRVGEWKECVAAAAAVEQRAHWFVTLACRLFGVDIQHPGVKNDRTVLWCSSELERDVSAAHAFCAARDGAAAGGHLCNQQPLPAQIDTFACVPDIQVWQLIKSVNCLSGAACCDPSAPNQPAASIAINE
jgi:hypothetical protein